MEFLICRFGEKDFSRRADFMNADKTRKQSPLKRELASGKPVVTTTLGNSMEPLLYSRSTRVVIRRVEEELKKNDLPLYQRPDGQFVMHRVIKKDETFYYTRGDNRFGLERVPKEWVLGVVTEIYRKKKHFMVTDAGYRCYVAFWQSVYPLRWMGHQIKRVMNKVWKTKGRKDC